MKECPFCRTINESSASTCDCGYSFTHGCIIPLNQREKPQVQVHAASRQVLEASKHLQPGESVRFWTEGLYSGRARKLKAAVIATELRLIIFASKMFGYEMEELPYSAMTSIETSSDFLGRSATFICSNNRELISMMNNGDPDGLITFVRSKIGVSKETKPAAPSAPSSDLLSNLERLSSLREKGSLTEEEFAAAKRKLLGT